MEGTEAGLRLGNFEVIAFLLNELEGSFNISTFESCYYSVAAEV